MSKIKGLNVAESAQKDAEQWVELYVAGKRDAAAEQLAGEQRRSERATTEAIDARLDDLARSRE